LLAFVLGGTRNLQRQQHRNRRERGDDQAAFIQNPADGLQRLYIKTEEQTKLRQNAIMLTGT
jgi:hypothetical protein